MSLGISYFSLFSSCNVARSAFGDASLLIHDLLTQITVLQCKYAKRVHFITIAEGQQIQGTVHFFDPQGCMYEHDFLHSAVYPAKFPRCGTNLPSTSPHTSIFCSFQLGSSRSGQGRGRPAEVPLRESWLPAPTQLLSLTT